MKVVRKRSDPMWGDERDYPAQCQEGLPGEHSHSVLLEDAVHWVSVYGELLTFTRSLAAGAPIADAVAVGAERADGDGRSLDVAGLVERYEERYEFWRRRAGELAARAGC